MDIHTKLTNIAPFIFSVFRSMKEQVRRIMHKGIAFIGLYFVFFGLFVIFATLPISLLLRIVGVKSSLFYVRFVDDDPET